MKEYMKKGKTTMVPWDQHTNLQGVSVSEADFDNGSPRFGDMIAMNPDDPFDKWLVAKADFDANYIEVVPVDEEALKSAIGETT